MESIKRTTEENYLKIRLMVSLHTDELLDCLYDPRIAVNFLKERLSNGASQSGKTTGYMSLAAKALDAGYKGVIILTGMLESIRVQTNRI